MLLAIEPGQPVSLLGLFQFLEVFLGVHEGHNIIPVPVKEPHPDVVVEEDGLILLHGAGLLPHVGQMRARGPVLADTGHVEGLFVVIPVVNGPLIAGALWNIPQLCLIALPVHELPQFVVMQFILIQ